MMQKESVIQFGIPHYTIDCKTEFKEKVINNFIQEYEKARTPNPCIECNKYLKFGSFYQKAKELECDYIATGHYASIEFSENYKQHVLKRCKEEKKDQTYFLYTIPKEILSNIIFPLQKYNNKEEIRKIASENNLNVAQKKDSQEICFIPDNNYQNFLKEYGKTKQSVGNIVLKNGKILGRHKGLINYTIGQRKGLGIAYSEPLYVIELNKQKNEVVVGIEEQLYTNQLYAKELNWQAIEPKNEPINCMAKIRYRAKEAKVTIYPEKDGVRVIFDTKQRAITKGQSIVFYDNEGIVLGGGKIS